MNTPESYLILSALAELDGRRRTLESEAQALPAAIAARAAEGDARRGDFAEARGELENSQKERRRLGALVEDKTRLIVKYRDQLVTVKTNKEYQSLQHEIEVARREVSDAEDKLLELMVRLDGGQAAVVDRRRELTAAETADATADAADQSRLRDVDVQLLEVDEKRKRLLPQLPQNIRNEYQRIFDHYRGDAFAVAHAGVCQGCFVNVPAQVVSELAAGRYLYRCESCGRFILTAGAEWEAR